MCERERRNFLLGYFSNPDPKKKTVARRKKIPIS